MREPFRLTRWVTGNKAAVYAKLVDIWVVMPGQIIHLKTCQECRLTELLPGGYDAYGFNRYDNVELFSYDEEG